MELEQLEKRLQQAYRDKEVNYVIYKNSIKEVEYLEKKIELLKSNKD